jgi:opacity protein-like surface antigen
MTQNYCLPLIYCLALLISTTAQAEDITPPSSCSAGAAPSPFYFRADLGVVAANKIAGSYIPDNKLSARVGEGSALASIGIGYQFNEYIRTDITFTHIPKFTYRSLSSGESSRLKNISYNVTQDFQYTYAMINGYADILTWNNLSPYVMAGAGIALAKSQQYNHQHTFAYGIEDSPTTTHSSHKNGQSNYQYAWQIGAGAAYHLTTNLALDLNYRFIDLGKVKNGTLLTRANRTTSYSPADFMKLQSHMLTIGLRYNF